MDLEGYIISFLLGMVVMAMIAMATLRSRN